MLIEQLKETDISQYKELIDSCFGSSNPLDSYKKYERNSSYIIWVAKENEQIVGSITEYTIDLFTFPFQPTLMLFNVAVREDYRQQKIAQNLLDKIIENARDSGYKSISLTCLADAYPAQKLYESVGFKKANSCKYTIDL